MGIHATLNDLEVLYKFLFTIETKKWKDVELSHSAFFQFFSKKENILLNRFHYKYINKTSESK
jgi:hypothetical protein